MVERPEPQRSSSAAEGYGGYGGQMTDDSKSQKSEIGTIQRSEVGGQRLEGGSLSKFKISILRPSILSKCLPLKVVTENPKESAVAPMMRSWAPI